MEWFEKYETQQIQKVCVQKNIFTKPKAEYLCILLNIPQMFCLIEKSVIVQALSPLLLSFDLILLYALGLHL